MTNFKEIVTKAVVGRAKKNSQNNYTVQTEENPNTVLGCWVINHVFKGSKKNNDIVITGSYDVNIWYSYDNDSKTAVCTRNFSYEDNLNMRLKSLDIDNENIIIKALKQPTVSNVEIKNGNVNLTIDKELGVEVMGDARVKIAVEEDYEETYDDITEDDTDVELDEISEDFIK